LVFASTRNFAQSAVITDTPFFAKPLVEPNPRRDHCAYPRCLRVKTWRSRSAGDISLVMFALFCLGVLLWIVYGFSVGAVPVIVANVITLLLSMTILVFKIRYK
jgi:MtN3 and saliva related transmembrane protein